MARFLADGGVRRSQAKSDGRGTKGTDKNKNKCRCGEHLFPLQFVFENISLCPQRQTGVCLVTQLSFFLFLFSLGQGEDTVQHQDVKQIKKEL